MKKHKSDPALVLKHSAIVIRHYGKNSGNHSYSDRQMLPIERLSEILSEFILLGVGIFPTQKQDNDGETHLVLWTSGDGFKQS